MVKGYESYIDVVRDISKMDKQRELLVSKAFDFFEHQNVPLASMVKEAARDRRSAAYWMCRRIRGLEGRSAYETLAQGDEEILWDQLAQVAE